MSLEVGTPHTDTRLVALVNHMPADHITTKHPQGKTGRRIGRDRYDAMRQAITSALIDRELTHGELMDALHTTLARRFDGNISWYGETVKLDLEARKVIERTAAKPTTYRLTKEP
jgi:hypothetical protein